MLVLLLHRGVSAGGSKTAAVVLGAEAGAGAAIAAAAVAVAAATVTGVGNAVGF